MALVVLSRSSSFIKHVNLVVAGRVSFQTELYIPGKQRKQVLLVHSSSFAGDVLNWMDALPSTDQTIVGIAADCPDVAEMLEFSHKGAQAYFNSYMAAAHYKQMLRLIKGGQSWYPPQLMAQAFDLAHSHVAQKKPGDPLVPLTRRERDIALAVADGLNNKLVARQLGITERTVKTHLTHIFKKLGLKDRVSLVLLLNQFTLIKSDN